jgi:hypothetical protein
MMKRSPIEKPNHVSHPYKVECHVYSGPRRVLVGRVMFSTEPDAKVYAKGSGDGVVDLPVLKSKPGDTEFA